MSNVRKSVILGVVGCACILSGAEAQELLPPARTPGAPQSIDDVREEYRMHVGPFHMTPAILLKEFGVDTNVFNQQGNEQSDFTFTITPQAHVAVPVARRGLVKAALGTDLVYFARYVSERSVDPLAIVRGELYAQRLTLFVDESYLNTRQLRNYTIEVRARRQENQLSGGGAFRFTPKFSLELARRHHAIRFDGDAIYLGRYLYETLNRDANVSNVTARYRHSGLTTLGLRYESQTDRFPFSPVRNTDSFRVMPGVELKPRAIISGRAWLGYRSFKPEAPVLAARAGFVAELALSYTLLGATAFGVTYNRDYDFAYEVLTPYFVDNTVGVSVRRAVGGRFDVVANAANHRYSYQPLIGGLVQSSPIADRIDTTRNYGINVGYRLQRQARVGFGISWWTHRSTDFEVHDYDDLRLGLTMNYGL